MRLNGFVLARWEKRTEEMKVMQALEEENDYNRKFLIFLNRIKIEMEESVYSCDISNTIVWNITIFPTSNNISFSQDLITDCMCRITFFQVQSIIIVNFIWLDIFIVYDDNRTSQRAKQFKEMVVKEFEFDFEDSFKLYCRK